MAFTGAFITCLGCGAEAEFDDVAQDAGAEEPGPGGPEDGEEVATAESAVYGGFRTSNCDERQQTVLRHDSNIARVITSSAAFEKCVRTRVGNAVFGNGCSGDPWRSSSAATRANKLIAAARMRNWAEIECTDASGCPSPGRASGCTTVDSNGYSDPGPETFKVVFGSVPSEYTQLLGACRKVETGEDEYECVEAAWTKPQVSTASTIVHEALHQHGYQDCGGKGYPYLAGYCIEDIYTASGTQPGLFPGAVPPCAISCSSGSVGIRTAASMEFGSVASYTDVSSVCECVRDTTPDSGYSGIGQYVASPRLDSGEAVDRYGAALASGDFDGDG
ncbi:MAG: hypothetical protein FJ104_04660, partial [Deltaproteobacteria bacterium]|nr:hypothetical protein [Deltaproteobacteria bacterium]